jgi:hypothetical protein
MSCARPLTNTVPGATARQLLDFGDATNFGKISGEYFSIGAGTDIAPLLQGLTDDACAAPHWGYVISGELGVNYIDGSEETCSGSAIFYSPPGHSVRAAKDTEVILFSPQAEHSEALDHMMANMGV